MESVFDQKGIEVSGKSAKSGQSFKSIDKLEKAMEMLRGAKPKSED